MVQNLYDIIDAASQEIIYSGLTRQEVHEKIGMSAQSVYCYSNNGLAYQGSYYINAREKEGWAKRFRQNWQAATERLKCIEGLERIKIVAEEGD